MVIIRMIMKMMVSLCKIDNYGNHNNDNDNDGNHNDGNDNNHNKIK